jgi:hypothetical protein
MAPAAEAPGAQRRTGRGAGADRAERCREPGGIGKGSAPGAQGRIRTRRGGAVSQVVEPEETEQRRRNPGARSGSRRQAVWLVR